MEDPTITKSPIGCTSENPDPSKLISWCKKHMVLWPKCQTGVLPSTGRAVLAAQDIPAGEVVVEVPDGMVLMAENCDIVELLEGVWGQWQGASGERGAWRLGGSSSRHSRAETNMSAIQGGRR